MKLKINGNLVYTGSSPTKPILSNQSFDSVLSEGMQSNSYTVTIGARLRYYYTIDAVSTPTLPVHDPDEQPATDGKTM